MSEQGRSARGPRPPATFRGWFLTLVVVGWASSVVLLALRAFVPGLAVLLGTAALLAVVDGRDLFTLYGRLPWERTETGGRALLVALVLVALPLVVTIYLLVALWRYLSRRRMRTARAPSQPVSAPSAPISRTPSFPATPSSPASLSSRASPPSQPGPALRPQASTMPPRRVASPPSSPHADMPDPTPAPPPPVPIARRGRPVLLAGCLAGGISTLLLSCGVLVFAAPGRLFVAAATPTSTPSATPSAHSTLEPTVTATSTSAATPTQAPTSATTPSVGPTPAATPSPTAPTATSQPSPAPTARPTPTPTAKHKHKHKQRTRTRRQHHRRSTAASVSPASGTTPILTFTCSPADFDQWEVICFQASAGQPVHVEIQYWCLEPAGERGDVRRTIPAAGDDALEWSWAPPHACSLGIAYVLLRAGDGDDVIEAQGTVTLGLAQP